MANLLSFVALTKLNRASDLAVYRLYLTRRVYHRRKMNTTQSSLFSYTSLSSLQWKKTVGIVLFTIYFGLLSPRESPICCIDLRLQVQVFKTKKHFMFSRTDAIRTVI